MQAQIVVAELETSTYCYLFKYTSCYLTLITLHLNNNIPDKVCVFRYRKYKYLLGIIC